MPSVTWSEAPSWARAACGVPVGRYIETPGSSSTSSAPASPWTSQSLVPWVWKTKTSWLSEWTAKPWEPGGVR